MGVLTDLASFLHDRWDEEEHDTALFHELDRPIQDGDTRRVCRCPCPARLLERIATDRHILKDCQQRTERERQAAGWPVDSTLAFQTMKALALPFELHPDWRDNWYP
ncbi:DUF6221 family protein [Streptomyces sp. NPDC058469]|uniref:DUF6221 family protein n=1 Tax=Streptomyces sp. NPDC058469 TaxID=3346514 RepID=UPI003647CA4F